MHACVCPQSVEESKVPAPAPEQKEQKEPKEKKEKKEKPAKEPKAPKEDGAYWGRVHTSCMSGTGTHPAHRAHWQLFSGPWRRCSGIVNRPSQSPIHRKTGAQIRQRRRKRAAA